MLNEGCDRCCGKEKLSGHEQEGKEEVVEETRGWVGVRTVAR